MKGHIVYLDKDLDKEIQQLSLKASMPISQVIRTLLKIALRGQQAPLIRLDYR